MEDDFSAGRLGERWAFQGPAFNGGDADFWCTLDSRQAPLRFWSRVLRIHMPGYRHLTSTEQLDRTWMESELFSLSDDIRARKAIEPTLKGRSLYCLF